MCRAARRRPQRCSAAPRRVAPTWQIRVADYRIHLKVGPKCANVRTVFYSRRGQREPVGIHTHSRIDRSNAMRSRACARAGRCAKVDADRRPRDRPRRARPVAAGARRLSVSGSVPGSARSPRRRKRRERGCRPSGTGPPAPPVSPSVGARGPRSIDAWIMSGPMSVVDRLIEFSLSVCGKPRKHGEPASQ